MMIPWLAVAKIGLVVVVIGGIAYSGYSYRDGTARREMAELTARLSQEREKAIAAALEETGRRLAKQKEIADAATARARQASRDAGAAATAALSLRTYADSLAERAAACDPSAADPGASARAAGLVLADMLKRLEERGRAAAGALDASFSAGVACEQAYESLSAR